MRWAACTALWIGVLTGSLAPFSSAAEDRPNIVIILADDMGYSDIGCFGGEIRTPALDRLADGGLRFTQFYNTGRCCPTRASLLTGLYPHQAGVGHMINSYTPPGHRGYAGDLSAQTPTIAEVLTSEGYVTFASGKWHVSKNVGPEGSKHNWPLQRGFDRFYGTITGAGSFFDPGTLTRGNRPISPFADPEYQPETFYYTDAITDHAIRFLEEHDGEAPFFLYVAYTAAHWPMHALPEDIERYRGVYDGGYASTRQARLERLERLGLLNESWTPAPLVGDWDAVEAKAWEARCMEVYAAMIDRMDQGIGRITQALEDRGELDDTLVLFLQDNGGCQESIGRTGDSKRPAVATLPKIATDALRQDVIPEQDRSGVPTLRGPSVMPGPADTYISYGLSWANVSNTPFREYKHFVHEGGIATPLIAHWPKGIDRAGELESQPGHLIDLMATCVDISGSDYSGPLEGVSLRPAFEGHDLERSGPIFFEHEGNRAIRDGRWKLVAKSNRAWELYDLEQDRAELHDLADEHPNRARQLAAAWEQWAERAQVLPLGGWRKPKAPERFNREQHRFRLGGDTQLPRSHAPWVVGRGWRVEVTLERFAVHGVLVAQGGSSDGWSLSLEDGHLAFSLRRRGDLTTIRSERPLEPTSKSLIAQVTKDEVTLLAGDRIIARGELPELLDRMPIDGLEVGRDDKGAVGHYRSPYPFEGLIQEVVLELTD